MGERRNGPILRFYNHEEFRQHLKMFTSIMNQSQSINQSINVGVSTSQWQSRNYMWVQIVVKGKGFSLRQNSIIFISM